MTFIPFLPPGITQAYADTLYAALSHTHAASAIVSGQLALARGGTNADLSATGGATSFLRQASAGAAITVGAIASADLTTALTTPPAIGGTTPAAGTFTTLTANTDLVANKGTSATNFFANGGGLAGATGTNNIAIGNGSLDTLDTGNENIAFGLNTLTALTTGRYNMGVGSASLQKVVFGEGNVAVGQGALLETLGSYNIGIGRTAGRRIASGSYNVAIGSDALLGTVNGNGSNNVVIGYQAGYNGNGLTGNVFIGYQAGYNEASSNRLYIENSNSATPLIYGEFDNDLVRIHGSLIARVADAATNTATTAITASHNSSGNPAAGFAVNIDFTLKSSTTNDRKSSVIRSEWNDSMNAAAIADLILAAYHNANGTVTEREGFRVRGGATATAIGFYGVTPTARQVLATGAGASVDDVITALQTLGLVSQS